MSKNGLHITKYTQTFLEKAASALLNLAPLKLQMDLGVGGVEGIDRGTTISKEKVMLEGSIWEEVLGAHIPPEASGCVINTRK